MKILFKRLVLPAIAVFSISSCVDAGMYGAAGGGPGYGSVSTGFQTYSSLPQNYNGNAYYYQGRYYSGGRYETGRYNYQGRSYSNRYSHNGQYYYGGTHQNYRGPASAPSSYRTSSSPSYRSSSAPTYRNSSTPSYRDNSPGSYRNDGYDPRRNDRHDHDRHDDRNRSGSRYDSDRDRSLDTRVNADIRPPSLRVPLLR